jgi:hypothetical protein
MKLGWFRRSGKFFIPVSFPGWLVIGAAVALGTWAVVEIDLQSDSVSDTIYGSVMPIVLIILGIYILAYVTQE